MYGYKVEKKEHVWFGLLGLEHLPGYAYIGELRLKA